MLVYNQTLTVGTAKPAQHIVPRGETKEYELSLNIPAELVVRSAWYNLNNSLNHLSKMSVLHAFPSKKDQNKVTVNFGAHNDLPDAALVTVFALVDQA